MAVGMAEIDTYLCNVAESLQEPHRATREGIKAPAKEVVPSKEKSGRIVSAGILGWTGSFAASVLAPGEDKANFGSLERAHLASAEAESAVAITIAVTTALT